MGRRTALLPDFGQSRDWHSGHDCLLLCESGLLAMYGLDACRTLYAKWDFAYSRTDPGVLFAVGRASRREVLSTFWQMEYAAVRDLPPEAWAEHVLAPLAAGTPVLIAVDAAAYPLAPGPANVANDYPHYVVLCEESPAEGLLVWDGWYRQVGRLPAGQLKAVWRGMAGIVRQRPQRTPSDRELFAGAVAQSVGRMLGSPDPTVGVGAIAALADDLEQGEAAGLPGHLVDALPHLIRERYAFHRLVGQLAEPLRLPPECLEAVGAVVEGWTVCRTLAMRLKITGSIRDRQRLCSRLGDMADAETRALRLLKQAADAL